MSRAVPLSDAATDAREVCGCGCGHARRLKARIGSVPCSRCGAALCEECIEARDGRLVCHVRCRDDG